jgi:hypothetical protein
LAIDYGCYLYVVPIRPKMRLNWRWFSPLSPRLPYCIGIFAPKLHRIAPQYEARKGDPQIFPNGDLMQMMSLKNIAFTFLFRSPDQETYPGYFTHPSNYLGNTFGLIKFLVHSEWTEYLHLRGF